MRSIWREDVPRTSNPISFFLFATKPHAGSALLAILAVVGASLGQSAIPYVYKLTTDGIIALTGGTAEPLVWAIVFYFAISLSSHLFWRISGFSGMYWATGVRATARDALFNYISSHSYQYFSNRFAGSLLSKIKQAGDGMRDVVGTFLWSFLGFAVTLVATFVIVFLTNPIAGFILLGLFVILVPYNYYYAKKRVPLSVAAQDAETALNGATVDALTNIFSVHEYAKRTFELDRLKTFTLRRRSLGMKNWRFGEWILLWNGIFVHIFMGAMVLFAVYLAVQGVITPSEVTLLLATVWLLEGYFVHLSQQFNSFSESWGQITESLTDILRPHEVLDSTDAKELKVQEGTLSFNKVSFDYDGVSVFKDLSFALSSGERIGVIGRSGAGKSTLTKLLLRHYDLSGGSITIDGVDIKTVTRESLRSSIAMVPQEPALFHRSIAENIAYARPDASRKEIIRAAELAQAHEFITSLPEGYESLVGERGVKLSGGQRQRIAIARALLKDAPILILDEATSALDSESEVLVQQALLKLMEGRTVIAIAHRLSTLRAMDRLLIFEKGVIIEDGSHEELLAKRGLYAELWNHQAGGFLKEDV